MNLPVCPRCRSLNLGASSECATCGDSLTGGTRAAARKTPASRLSGGALWLDDLTLPEPAPAVGESRNASAAESNRPRGEPTPPASRPATSDDPRMRRKVARRAHVRRLVMRDAAESVAATISSPRVLVLENDDGKRELLRSLLESFGFQVTSWASPKDLQTPLPGGPSDLVAVFVGIGPRTAHGYEGIELCLSLRQRKSIGPTGVPPALLLLADSIRPADRVQAALAGCSEVIVGPIVRASVAAALVRLGVTWPADLRTR